MYKAIKLPNEFMQFSNINNYLVNKEHKEENNLLTLYDKQFHGKFLVVSGPSGVGKSTALNVLSVPSISKGLNFKFVRRITTRTRRKTDSNIELGFVTNTEFSELERRNRLLYIESYGENRTKYGILFEDLSKAIQESDEKTVLVVIGTVALLNILPNSCYAYLMPPSLLELETRLFNSDKIHLGELLRYNLIEMSALIACCSLDVFVKRPISIIVNETNQESKCAAKIATRITDSQRYREIPNQLCVELSKEPR